MNGAFLAPPPIGAALTPRALTPQEEAAARADCSCPRGGGWRPGARWAENAKERTQLMALKARMAADRDAPLSRAARKAERQLAVEAQIAALPAHQRPQMRELGRRTEAAPVAFKPGFPAMPRDGEAADGEVIPFPGKRLATPIGVIQPERRELSHSSPMNRPPCPPDMAGQRGALPSRSFRGEGDHAPEPQAQADGGEGSWNRRQHQEPHAPSSGRSPSPGNPGEGQGGLFPSASQPKPPLPLVIAQRTGQRMMVTAACPEALRQGLAPGLPLSQARALVPGLDVREAAPDKDAALLERLALLAARRWTPRAATDGDGLWLDLSGVAHLFGGEAALCARILHGCARLGLTARIAVAGSYGAAHALARTLHDAPITLCPSGAEAEALAPLPLARLRLDESDAATASRLGLDRIGDLLAMPRAPLGRRFGAGLLARLDQALGRLHEPFDPVVPEEPPAITLRFAEPIETAEAIGQALCDAMPRLLADLGEAGLGVRLLRLLCTRVDNQVQEARIGTARATRDGAHLLRLLTPRIETIDPGFGVERLTLLASRVEPLRAVAIDGALAGEAPAPDLAPLIDRLAGRLGARRLYRMSAVESDVPERSAERVGALAAAKAWPDWPRPARLFSPPEPLANVVAMLPDRPPVRFTWRGRAYSIARADGPERIHGEWWRRRSEGEAVRDYFAVEEEGGRRFWLFRKGDGVDGRTGDLTWWMQGVFG